MVNGFMAIEIKGNEIYNAADEVDYDPDKECTFFITNLSEGSELIIAAEIDKEKDGIQGVSVSSSFDISGLKCSASVIEKSVKIELLNTSQDMMHAILVSPKFFVK